MDAMQKSFRRKLRSAEKHLSSSCPKLSDWIAEVGGCELEPVWEREPFESLVRAVAHQQLHGKAAESILGRMIARFPDQAFPTPLQLSRMRVPSFRKCGFSASKTEAIQGIAKGTLQGKVPNRETANSMSDESLVETLTELRGIGRWTVEMLLIFTMGRLDIMPVDDFGVRAGLRHLYDLTEMPKKIEFAKWTDSWQPYRSIGAWYLWRLADARK
jgi:DNA-3-methyladenine glycosylase II